MKSSSLLSLSILLLFTLSCKKSQVEDSTPVLLGGVVLHDEGSKIIESSGVKVSVENSNPEISAISDSKGEFSLDTRNISGEFVLVFEKQGMGIHKRFLKKSADGILFEKKEDGSYKQLNKRQYYDLGIKSSVVVNSMNAAVANGKLKLTINISSSNTTGEKYIRLLLQKDLSSISINTVNKEAKNTGIIWPVQNGDNEFNICLECTTECQQYLSGDRIYMTAYGESLYSNFYSDTRTMQWIFPNLRFQANNPITSFQMP